LIDATDFGPQFRAKLDEIELQFAEKQVEVAAARQDVAAAEDAAFKAQLRLEHFQLVVLRATRHSVAVGVNEITGEPRMLSLITAPIDQIAADELELKRAADLALTRARKLLANAGWQLADLRDAVTQLRQCITPVPDAPRKLEVVKRPERPAIDDLDDIIPPATRPAA
jgi:hypothetical protein